MGEIFKELTRKLNFSQNFSGNFLMFPNFPKNFQTILFTDQLLQGLGGSFYDNIISFFKRWVWALIIMFENGQNMLKIPIKKSTLHTISLEPQLYGLRYIIRHVSWLSINSLNCFSTWKR